MGGSSSKLESLEELEIKGKKYLNKIKKSGLIEKFMHIKSTKYANLLYDIFQDLEIFEACEVCYFINTILPILDKFSRSPEDAFNSSIVSLEKASEDQCVQYKYSNWVAIYKTILDNKDKLASELDSIIDKMEKVKKDQQDAMKLGGFFVETDLFKKLIAINNTAYYYKICELLQKHTKLSLCEISYFMEYIVTKINIQINEDLASEEYKYVNLFNILSKIQKYEKVLMVEVDKINIKDVPPPIQISQAQKQQLKEKQQKLAGNTLRGLLKLPPRTGGTNKKRRAKSANNRGE